MFIFNRIPVSNSCFLSLYKIFSSPSFFPYLDDNITLNILNTYRNSSCYVKYKYSIEVETALNKQIASEQNAAFTYLSMSAHFLHARVSYPGVGGFFMKLYEEELGHMKTLINYQIIRGGNPVFEFNVVEPVNLKLTVIEAFNCVHEIEKKVTEELENIVKTAKTAQDTQTEDLITSKFLSEQMLAMNELSQHITKLNRLSDDNHALYQYDLNLSKQYPYSLKVY